MNNIIRNKYIKYFFRVIGKISIALIIFVLMLVSTGWVPNIKPLPAPKKTEATYQFNPTNGAIVTGSNPAILGATAANAEGINMGSWWGALADDNLHFGITSTTGGYNAYLDIGNVQLNGANKLIIQTEFDLDATAPATLVQICDWTSTTGVHNAADAQCTGGGWRNLNLNDTTITTATGTAYDWEIYDGYWNTSATAKISTPLSNFVDGSDKIRIRYYSTTNTTSVVHIDYARVYAVINPVYSASGATNLGSGTPLGDYSLATVGGAGNTGTDNVYFRVPGTAGSVSDFYMSFTGVETYTGANTILVRAEYSCSAAGINHRPKIWNFTLAQWEDLSTASIACSTTDATNAWAKNNITISDYVSAGEVRVGWRGLANGTQEIRLDYMYMMIGTTNTSGTSEISFGSNSAGDVTNTRTLDMNAAASTWNILTADESNTQAFAQYGNDNDNDVTVEEAAAANIDFSVTAPTNAAVTGIFFASHHMAGTAGTVQVGLKDYGGLTGTVGGWSAVGATASTSLIYTDNMTVASVASGGAAGWNTNPEDHIDTVGNEINMRLRTTASGSTASNSVRQWDFAMVSIQWTEDADHPSQRYQFNPTGGAIVTGSNPAILGATAASTEGVNMGSWWGALADDNLHFGITSTTGGYNAYLDIGNVQLNGANKIIIQSEIDVDATLPNTLVQICDWTSTTGVHNAADAQCTGGGWRNLNLNDETISPSTPTTFDWQIYDGYWNTSATAKISTPLSNFVDGSDKIRIRYYSTTNTTSLVHIDYLRVFAVINPLYSASGATNLGSGTPLGDYSLATVGGIGGGGAARNGSDNVYFRVPGTAGSVSDFYMSFTGVETYTGANTILVRAEYSCSAAGINHRPKIWNFTLAQWEDLSTASIACSTTDATNAWAKNNITISDYVSGGEVRVGWRGLANGTQEIRLDYMYMMIGTTNTSGTSEISFGSNSAGSVTNTRDLDMTGSSNTWNILTADESNTQAFAQYGNDNDNDVTVEEAAAANIDFSVTAPTNAAVTGIFFASRHMAGTAGTVQAGIKDYSGLTGTVGGWSAVGAAATTALAYTDNMTVSSVASGGAAGWNTNPEDHIDTVGNEINMRLRTTASGSTASNSVRQWDFAMVSIQWTEIPVVGGGTLTFSLSDNSIGFGTLTSSAARYANGAATGSASETEAHNIIASTNASSGYVITLNGTTLTSGGDTITAIGASNTASSAGTEQFGLRIDESGGNGAVSAPYADTGFAFDTASFPDQIASDSDGDDVSTTYSIRYLGNISGTTESGSYSTVITYVITAGF